MTRAPRSESRSALLTGDDPSASRRSSTTTSRASTSTASIAASSPSTVGADATTSTLGSCRNASRTPSATDS